MLHYRKFSRLMRVQFAVGVSLHVGVGPKRDVGRRVGVGLLLARDHVMSVIER